jgi:mRNA interferase MazF
MSMPGSPPARGEIWFADLSPVRGHEQAGARPVLIVSVDLFNTGPAGLVIVCPITTKAKGVRSHIPVIPPDGGMTSPSYIKCEDVRSISTERLVRALGAVKPATVRQVESILRILMGL